MIKYLYLDNYKCFTNQYINFSNFVLFVGDNSAGKSAVIDAINAIKSELNVYFKKTSFEGKSFNSLISKGNKSKGYFEIGYSEKNEYGSIATLLFIAEREGSPFIKFAFRYYFVDKVLTISRLRGEYISHFIQENVDMSGFRDFIEHCNEIDLNSISFSQGEPIDERFRDSIINTSYVRDLCTAFKIKFSYSLYRKIESFSSTKVEEIRKKLKGEEHLENMEYDPYGGDIITRIKKEQNKKSSKYEKLNEFGKNNGLYEMIYVVNEKTSFLYSYNYLIVENKGQKIPIEYVGTGISQLIPIVFESMNNRNILIKQPELHLHPKVQYSLGKHIASSILNNQCFIETHSQYIVDSIRHYSRGRDDFANNVRIIFFSNDFEMRKLSYIDIDSNGNMFGDGLEHYNSFFFDFLMNDIIGENMGKESKHQVFHNETGDSTEE